MCMTYNKWKQLAEEGYNSDVIAFLGFLEQGEEIEQEHSKSKAILNMLIRKELITEENKLTLLGKEMLEMANSDNLFSPVVIPRAKESFDEWWKCYPPTDGFEIDGRTFMPSQSKRIKKDACKAKWKKLLNEGIKAEDIINATAYHIEQVKKISAKKSQNQLSFVPNSERYIREELFIPYIELSKSQIKEPEFKSNIL